MPDKPAMPAFDTSPATLVDRFATTLVGVPGVSLRRMFGYPAAFVNGNLATSLHRANWVVRLPGPAADELLAIEGAAPFEPMPGRPMRGYVVLPPAVVADDDDLAAWVARAIEYAASLPPKPGKG